jgi:SAM-dependent methyltransferase
MLGLLKQWITPQPRVEQSELLDLGEGTTEEARDNLRDMGRINRWLGGHAALRRFLLPRLRRMAGGAPLRVLDVGSGDAHTPLMLAQWARRQGVAVRIVALDASQRHLAVAGERIRSYPEVTLVSADARGLPFPRDSFDCALSTQFLHHLNPIDLAATLRGLTVVCRGPIVLNDLVRSRTAAFLFRRCAPLLFNNRLTLHDGLVSIGQSYTPSEMREILHGAGLSHARVHSHGLYHRMTVVIERNGAGSPAVIADA